MRPHRRARVEAELKLSVQPDLKLNPMGSPTMSFAAMLWRAKMCAVSLASLTACGSASFHKSDKRGGQEAVQLAGDAGKGSPDEPCYQLGYQTPGQYPGQNPGQYPGQNPEDGGTDVVVIPPKGDEPQPPPPGAGCDGPGQEPCAKDCDGDVYRPIDQDDDYVPTPYPGQQPIDPGTCGKEGKYCDDGGPGQWPGQTMSGGHYDRGEVTSCLDGFRRAGYDTQGQWNIDVREIKNVSVLSDSVVSDFGTEHKVVIIKSVNVLGRIHFELVNPNALYCIKSNVSVLQEVYLTSCHQNSVFWGKDVNVLSRVNGRVVDCR